MNRWISLNEITELLEATTEISIISESTRVLPCAGKTRGAVVVACENHREKGLSADLFLSRPMRQDWRDYSLPSPSLKLAQEMQGSQLSSNPSFLSGDCMVSSSLKIVLNDTRWSYYCATYADYLIASYAICQ